MHTHLTLTSFPHCAWDQGQSHLHWARWANDAHLSLAQWHHIGGLESAVMDVFIPPNWHMPSEFFPRELTITHLPANPCSQEKLVRLPRSHAHDPARRNFKIWWPLGFLIVQKYLMTPEDIRPSGLSYPTMAARPQCREKKTELMGLLHPLHKLLTKGPICSS